MRFDYWASEPSVPANVALELGSYPMPCLSASCSLLQAAKVALLGKFSGSSKLACLAN